MQDSAPSPLQQAAQGVPAGTVAAAAEVLAAVGREPGRAVLMGRALHVLAHVVRGIDRSATADAAGAGSDLDALLTALERSYPGGGADSEIKIDRARMRGLREREALLHAEGGTHSTHDVARLLGLTPQAVNKRRRSGSLIGLSLGRRGYTYPAWQFDRHGTLTGLPEVLAALGESDPWVQASFMLGSNIRLGGETPLSGLRRGALGDVLRAARSYGEHGSA